MNDGVQLQYAKLEIWLRLPQDLMIPVARAIIIVTICVLLRWCLRSLGSVWTWQNLCVGNLVRLFLNIVLFTTRLKSQPACGVLDNMLD